MPSSSRPAQADREKKFDQFMKHVRNRRSIVVRQQLTFDPFLARQTLPDGRTPLMWALEDSSKSGIAKMLLAASDLQAPSPPIRVPGSVSGFMKTPLATGIASARSVLELEAGAFPVTTRFAKEEEDDDDDFLLSLSGDGTTHLMRAAFGGHLDCLPQLLAHDKPHDCCSQGYNALMLACVQAHADVVQVLLPLCPVLAINRDGLDAMDLAVKARLENLSGATRCIELLAPFVFAEQLHRLAPILHKLDRHARASTGTPLSVSEPAFFAFLEHQALHSCSTSGQTPGGPADLDSHSSRRVLPRRL